MLLQSFETCYLPRLIFAVFNHQRPSPIHNVQSPPQQAFGLGPAGCHRTYCLAIVKAGSGDGSSYPEERADGDSRNNLELSERRLRNSRGEICQFMSIYLRIC